MHIGTSNPAMEVSPGCVVCVEADIRGTVKIGKHTVVHPYARILATNGPIIIGDSNIIEEFATIENKSPEPLVIGNQNVFEVRSTCNAKRIGDQNILEASCFVGEIQVGNGITFGAGTRVCSGQNFPDNSVLFGNPIQHRISKDLPQNNWTPEGGQRGDIEGSRHHSSHFNLATQHHRNHTIVPVTPTQTDYGENSLEEEVDHILILLATLLPLILAVSIIAALALLIRRMKNGPGDRRTCGRESVEDHSFSSLPAPSPTSYWREDSFIGSKVMGHSLSMPHLLLLGSSSHSVSLPQLLAIESYYNYPSTSSIMDETFADVVDQAKIQAEVARELSSDQAPVKTKSHKRSLSLKNLRRFRTRIIHIITFRRRREQRRNKVEDPLPNTFNLSNLPNETRQQLKQIYVY